jgi:DNA-binding SARP family transcriptional activator/tetratricopeptide (TPR) repeat protein
MADQLEVQLLGGFSVRLSGQPLHSFRSAKTRGLLAYLAAQPDQEHSRDLLATLLWGDLPDTAARTNLRIELSNLKKVLADHPTLEITRGSARIHSGRAAIDTHQFQGGVAGFMALSAELQGGHLPELVAAIDHYQGEFLAGFHLDDAVEFEEWQLLAREQFHELMMQALEILQLRYAEQGHWAELAGIARRQLAWVPWAETAHRNLIHALAAQGEIGAALSQYEKCREILRAELGVDPSPATRAFVERLRDGSTSPAPTVQHNLPPQLKSLVGRKEEIARLHTLVQTEQLVTLLGIGGVGKSHLAQAVARHALRDFGDGVWFVPLANIEAGDTAPERIALAIAAAIGYPVTQTQTPLAELAAALANKRLLLVLDNWDHLIAAAEIVFDALLQHTPVHVLATSRTRVMIEGEIPIRLDGLPLAEASALFMERARRVVPGFAGESGGEIERVCEAVAGLPLGIELAASWVEHYAVADIARSIAQIEVQPAQGAGMVNRHHSLSRVFEYSWRLLSPRQQEILARLSVFRGGFDQAAALAVAEGDLGELSLLIHHSLVQRVAAGRYDLHPLIREFAAQKLMPSRTSNLYHNYSHYYLQTLLATPQTQWAGKFLVDLDNASHAWQLAVRASDAPLIEQMTITFGEFIFQFGLMTDGETLLQEAVDRFDGQAQHRELVARLLDRHWLFVRALRGIDQELSLLQRILALSSQHELLTRTHIQLANRYSETGNWAQMNAHFDQAEALAQSSSDLLLYINTVESRIHINAIHFQGDFALGIARLQEMLALLEAQGEGSAADEEMRVRVQQNLAGAVESQQQQDRLWFLLDLSLAEQFAGLYEQAIQHNEEALALAEMIEDYGDMGLLNANLCLTLRQHGRLEQALAHGLAGIDLLQQMGFSRQEGQARNRVGHTLLALERWADGYDAYDKALAVWATMQHPNRYEALAGQSVAALHLGNPTEALTLVDEVLAFVAAQGLMGIVEPALLLRNCETVLRLLGQTAQARQVHDQAEAWINQIATRISDEKVRAAFVQARRATIQDKDDK